MASWGPNNPWTKPVCCCDGPVGAAPDPGPTGDTGPTGPTGTTGPIGPGAWFDNFTFGLSFVKHPSVADAKPPEIAERGQYWLSPGTETVLGGYTIPADAGGAAFVPSMLPLYTYTAPTSGWSTVTIRPMAIAYPKITADHISISLIETGYDSAPGGALYYTLGWSIPIKVTVWGFCTVQQGEPTTSPFDFTWSWTSPELRAVTPLEQRPPPAPPLQSGLCVCGAIDPSGPVGCDRGLGFLGVSFTVSGPATPPVIPPGSVYVASYRAISVTVHGISTTINGVQF